MSNPAFDLVDKQAQSLAERGRIAVVIERDTNSHAEPYDLAYSVHSFSVLSQYEAWLDEHYDWSAIEEDPQTGFRRPEFVHDGAMGEVFTVEVHTPVDLHTRVEPARPGMARVAQESSALTRMADELAYSRPDLTFAHVSDPHGWGHHDRLHAFDAESLDYDLVVDAWSLPGSDPSDVRYSVHAREASDDEVLEQKQNLSHQEATEQALELVATMPSSEIHPEEALKQRQTMLAAMNTEQLSGPGYTTGPEVS